MLFRLTCAFFSALMIFSATAYEKDVSIWNSDSKIMLAGTLSTPDNPRGAIVLVSGSGAQNRDEEIFGLKPFKILSDSLSSSGYAVLRMDDRGVGNSEGDNASALLSDFDSDAAAGLAFLDSCFHDKPKGIIGHSLGGTTAIRMASSRLAKSTSPDFIITLGAPAWRGDSLIMSQSRALATAMTGEWSGEKIQRKIIDIAKGSLPSSIASAMIYSILATEMGEMANLPQVKSQISSQVDIMTSQQYREMLRFDPANDISLVKIPWLAVNGEKDLQVLPANLSTISDLNHTAHTLLLPSHNHLFQIAVSGLPQEYVQSGQSPSSQTLTAIIAWLASVIPTP